MTRRPNEAPMGRMSDAQCQLVLDELRRIVLGTQVGPFALDGADRPELVPTRKERVMFDIQLRQWSPANEMVRRRFIRRKTG